MERRNLIKEIIMLSQAHFKATIEEDWDTWEHISKQKERLYKKLREISKGSIRQDEVGLLLEAHSLDEKTKNELIHKREEAKQSIVQLGKNKTGVKGYRQRLQKAAKRHLFIKC